MESLRVPSQSVYPWTPPAGGNALVAATVSAGVFTAIAFLAMIALVSVDSTAPPPESALPAVAFGVLVVVGLATLAVQRYGEIAASVRAMVVLAVAQGAIAIGALVLWQVSSARIALWRVELPIARSAIAPAVALALSVLVVIAAALQTPRRSGTPRWLQAVAAFALVFLVAVALWLPVYARIGEARVIGVGTAAVERLLASVLIAPALAALFAAVVVARRPRWRSRFARIGLFAGGALFAIALPARVDCGAEERAVYSNFVPVVIGAAWFALATIAAVAVTHVRALRVVARDGRRPAPWRQQGTVVVKTPSSTTVGHLINAGWLAGLEGSTAAFVLRTKGGDLPVPAGAAVDAPLPPWTAQAELGAAVPVVSEGDRVEVSGYVAATGVDPYRSAGRPVPGTAGLVVSTARRLDEPVARDLILRVWRPCAALLIAITVAGVPGLIGLIASAE